MKLKNIRTGRLMSVQAPVFFLAREQKSAFRSRAPHMIVPK